MSISEISNSSWQSFDFVKRITNKSMHGFIFIFPATQEAARSSTFEIKENQEVQEKHVPVAFLQNDLPSTANLLYFYME